MGIILTAGIIAGLSLLIIIHEAGHFIVGKLLGFYIKEFGIGYPPRIFSKTIKETVYSVNWIIFGGFVRFFDSKYENDPDADESRSFSRQSILKRFLMVSAGIVINFLAGWILFSFVFMVGVPESLLVTGVKENSAAMQSGIEVGDQIMDFSARGGSSSGGRKVADLSAFLERNKGQEVVIKIKRAGVEQSVPAFSPVEVENGEGRLGVYLNEIGVKKFGFFRSFWEGLVVSVNSVVFGVIGFIKVIAMAFTDIKALGSVVGPVGIASMAIQTSKLGFVYFMQVMAMISLGLAAFNIFPIPSLDGGRLLFLLVEKIKGSPLSLKTEMYIFGSSFIFLFIVALLVTVKDIVALF